MVLPALLILMLFFGTWVVVVVVVMVAVAAARRWWSRVTRLLIGGVLPWISLARCAGLYDEDVRGAARGGRALMQTGAYVRARTRRRARCGAHAVCVPSR